MTRKTLLALVASIKDTLNKEIDKVFRNCMVVIFKKSFKNEYKRENCLFMGKIKLTYSIEETINLL